MKWRTRTSPFRQSSLISAVGHQLKPSLPQVTLNTTFYSTRNTGTFQQFCRALLFTSTIFLHRENGIFFWRLSCNSCARVNHSVRLVQVITVFSNTRVDLEAEPSLRRKEPGRDHIKISSSCSIQNTVIFSPHSEADLNPEPLTDSKQTKPTTLTIVYTEIKCLFTLKLRALWTRSSGSSLPKLTSSHLHILNFCPQLPSMLINIAQLRQRNSTTSFIS